MVIYCNLSATIVRAYFQAPLNLAGHLPFGG
jgi:hypothetical protein